MSYWQWVYTNDTPSHLAAKLKDYISSNNMDFEQTVRLEENTDLMANRLLWRLINGKEVTESQKQTWLKDREYIDTIHAMVSGSPDSKFRVGWEE